MGRIYQQCRFAVIFLMFQILLSCMLSHVFASEILEGTYVSPIPVDCNIDTIYYDEKLGKRTCPIVLLDCFSIARLNIDTYWFSVQTHGQNGHQCNASGIAKTNKAGNLEYQGDPGFADRLELIFDKDSIKIEPLLETLRPLSCGVRTSWFDREGFPLNTRVSSNAFDCGNDNTMRAVCQYITHSKCNTEEVPAELLMQKKRKKAKKSKPESVAP